MSAAEPANPARPAMNTRAPGTVIDLNKRRRRHSMPTGQGGWTMTTPPEPAHGPEQTALARWAEDIEATFNAHGQTLTDDDTAATFVLTLKVCARVLEGSQATGLIEPGQLKELLGLVGGMEQAPRLLA